MAKVIDLFLWRHCRWYRRKKMRECGVWTVELGLPTRRKQNAL
jgi:hypothetical protein